VSALCPGLHCRLTMGPGVEGRHTGQQTLWNASVGVPITAWSEVRVLSSPPRIPTPMEVSQPSGNCRPIGRLIGVGIVSSDVSLNFPGMFCPLCLRSKNSVSRKPRIWFAETRFECELTDLGRPSLLEWPTKAIPMAKSTLRPFPGNRDSGSKRHGSNAEETVEPQFDPAALRQTVGQGLDVRQTKYLGTVYLTVAPLETIQFRALRRSRADALRQLGAEVMQGDLTDLTAMHRAIEGCPRVYFGISVSADYLTATVNTAAVARHHGVEAFVNMSQMTVTQMSITESTDSPQQKLHWLAEQALSWSGLPVVTMRPTVFLEGFFRFFAAAGVLDADELPLPMGDGETSPISAVDVARAVRMHVCWPAHFGLKQDIAFQ
jgi:hypothetical protein